MRDRAESWVLPSALAVTVVLVGWAILSVSQTLAYSFRLSWYLLANLLFFLDFWDFAWRLYLRRLNGVAAASTDGATSTPLDIGPYTPYQRRLHVRPYAILASVHNAEDSIDAFLESMARYRDRCWIIDDGSSDNTVRRIRQAGWRCVEGGENRKKPGAIRKLLEALPREIETVLVVDPDVTIEESGPGRADLETVIFEFQRSGMAALCPRLAVRRDGLLARLQALEYCMAFSLGRMSLADHGINSGISVYRRDALAAALERHSLSVYAEDLENSVILLGRGERIYYDSRLVVTTQVPQTVPRWFSQRVGWAYGLIKVYSERVGDIRSIARRRLSAAYQFIAYAGVSCLLMQPLKIAALVLLLASVARALDGLFGLDLLPRGPAEPVYFVAAYLKYTLLAFAALWIAVPRGERAYLVPIVPVYFFYAILQIVPNTVGYLNWFSLRLSGRRLLADHYQDEQSIRREHKVPAAAARWATDPVNESLGTAR